jgi:hypothetical protein
LTGSPQSGCVLKYELQAPDAFKANVAPAKNTPNSTDCKNAKAPTVCRFKSVSTNMMIRTVKATPSAITLRVLINIAHMFARLDTHASVNDSRTHRSRLVRAVDPRPGSRDSSSRET